MQSSIGCRVPHSRRPPSPNLSRIADLLTLLKVFLMAATGILLGLGATWLAVDRGLGFGAIRAGVWTAWPKTGSLAIDPYSSARLARTGEIPLGLAEGLSLIASQDEDGQTLTGTCEYLLTGRMPPARFWTLTPSTPRGALIDNRAHRFGLTSSEILRRDDGDFQVLMAPNARPGNWLPVETASDFMLVLRLYDTAVSATSTAIEAATLPQVRKVACR